jgi:hypothetical protein
MQDYVRNRANPVQGVPFTDPEGNSGIQFIRPGQMQAGQQGSLPTFTDDDWNKAGGPTQPASGVFPR